MFGMANLLPNAVVPSWYPKFLSHDPQHAPVMSGPTIGLANQGNLKVPLFHHPGFSWHVTVFPFPMIVAEAAIINAGQILEFLHPSQKIHQHRLFSLNQLSEKTTMPTGFVPDFPSREDHLSHEKKTLLFTCMVDLYYPELLGIVVASDSCRDYRSLLQQDVVEVFVS